MDKIDFVVTWVDNSDPVWVSAKKRYEGEDCLQIREQSQSQEISQEDANGECRFREFGFLRYWFRAVENCAPWVNRIHFVTCGQKPAWLNENHPQLNLVNHSDFISEEYLPTFNSNTIELNLHNIKGLAERFVLFNDDVILLRPLTPSFFFNKDKPVLVSDLRYPGMPHINTINRIKVNNYIVVNNHFNIRKAIWDNRWKWFNPFILGPKMARINFVCYLANKTLPVGMYGHVAFPHLKSTFFEVWKSEYSILDQTSRYRFRSDNQVNQWMLCAWNQAKGLFSPTVAFKVGKHIDVSPDTLATLVGIIKDRSFPQICINDSRFNTDVSSSSAEIISALNYVYPNKSQFEKY